MITNETMVRYRTIAKNGGDGWVTVRLGCLGAFNGWEDDQELKEFLENLTTEEVEIPEHFECNTTRQNFYTYIKLVE